jgi:curved DNA-binding protein CbpA
MSDIPANRPPAAAGGTLAKTPAIHLLLYAHDKRLAGTVEFTVSGEPGAFLLFVGGHPAKARTTEPVSYLGRVLLELGYITEMELTRSLTELARAKSGGLALHGQLLLAARAIDDEKLQAGLGEQLARALRHVASLPPETTFAYYDGFDGLTGWGPSVAQGFDPVPMIWGMLRANPPQAHISAALDRVMSSRLRLVRGVDLMRLGLSAEHRRVAELLTVPMGVAEVMAASDLGEAETRLLAYLLLVTKQVDLLRSAEGRAPLAAASSTPPSVQGRVSSAPMPAASRPAPPPTPVPLVGPSPSVRISTSKEPVASGRRSPQGLSPELAERWSEILDRATTIDRTDYFVMLGLSRDAVPEDVEAAFFALAKKWHPDRLSPELGPVRSECSRVFARMSEAHATLSDAESRKQYMELLAEGSGSPDVRETVLKVVEAATDFQKAEVCLRRGDLVQAESLCRKALEADATQPDYLAMLAWLLAVKPENQSPEKTRESIQMLDRAISMSGRSEKAHFWRGMLNKRLGKADTAFRDFKTAAELNPRNIDAAREVRLHRMRRGSRSSSPPPGPRSGPPPGSMRPTSNSVKPEDSKPGLLGRLFKKP